MPLRLYSALVAFAAISVMAAFTLEGQFRIAVWILMAGLALKTWLASKLPKP
ncbi:MAG: hypothetical protein ABI823_18865 [Bryobacteraceae bacterium]